MRNFDTSLDRQRVSRIVHPTTVARSKPTAHKSHLVTHNMQRWTWRQVRDYIIEQIEARQGAQHQEVAKDAGIIKAFCNRWGDLAPHIAQYAYETADGVWDHRPITVLSFCKAGDARFASVIADRLHALDTAR